MISGSTLPTVTSPVPIVDWARSKLRWPYLTDLLMSMLGGRVDILLGQDIADLMPMI